MITIRYTDFEYDGVKLSDFGFVICDFDGSGDEKTESAGSVITFNRVSRHSGKLCGLTSTKYDECLEIVFDICKNDCEDPDNLVITDNEFRSLMRWLNRRRFLKFNFIEDESETEDSEDAEENISDSLATENSTCYYNASFNIEKITIADELCGLRLTMETDKPFGYGAKETVTYTFEDSDEEYTLRDISDEIGDFVPDIKITCLSAGTLQVTNSTLDSVMVIKNCSVNEVINIFGDTLIITTSKASHRIGNDFNYEFLKIGNAYNDRDNVISASMPCTIEISYYPIIKTTP